jgi:hypothetical protein
MYRVYRPEALRWQERSAFVRSGIVLSALL